MSYPANEQEAVLGALLMDIVHGYIEDETIRMVDQIEPDDVAGPMRHLVSYVQGMNLAPDMRSTISRDLLDELRIITIEELETLWPPPEEERPGWETPVAIPARATVIIKELLLDTLQGEISVETRATICAMGNLDDVPQPYRDLLSHAQRFPQEGKELAWDLLASLRYMTDEQLRSLRWR